MESTPQLAIFHEDYLMEYAKFPYSINIYGKVNLPQPPDASEGSSTHHASCRENGVSKNDENDGFQTLDFWYIITDDPRNPSGLMEVWTICNDYYNTTFYSAKDTINYIKSFFETIYTIQIIQE